MAVSIIALLAIPDIPVDESEPKQTFEQKLKRIDYAGALLLVWNTLPFFSVNAH
jgi:hypothetical protein